MQRSIRTCSHNIATYSVRLGHHRLAFWGGCQLLILLMILKNKWCTYLFLQLSLQTKMQTVIRIIDYILTKMQIVIRIIDYINKIANTCTWLQIRTKYQNKKKKHIVLEIGDLNLIHSFLQETMGYSIFFPFHRSLHIFSVISDFTCFFQCQCYNF